MLRALGILTVLVVGGSFFKKAIDFKNKISYRFENWKLGDVNWTSATIKITCIIRNDNPQTLDLQGFEGTVTQNSIVLADITTGGNIALPKGEEKRVAINIKVSNDMMLTRIQEIMKRPGDALKPFAIEGYLTVSGFQLPVYQQIQLLSIG